MTLAREPLTGQPLTGEALTGEALTRERRAGVPLARGPLTSVAVGRAHAG